MIIIGNRGWKILVVCNCAVNLVGYNSKNTRKPNCPIVCAACVAKQADGSKVLVVAFEGVMNKGSSTSLISEFQVCEAGNIIDSVSKRHTGVDGNPGTQCMKLKGDNDDLVTIAFITRSGLMNFEHWEPNEDELHDLPCVYLSERAPCNPPKYYDDHDTIPPMLSPEDIAVMATTTGEVPSSELPSDPTAGESNDPAPLSEEPDLLFFDAIQPEEPELPFIDASAGEDEYYYDPSDLIAPAARHGRAFHLTIDYDAYLREQVVDDFLDDLPMSELTGYHDKMDTCAYTIHAAATLQQAEKVQPYLGYRPLEIICRTLENTTQLTSQLVCTPMCRHVKSLYPFLNQKRLYETISTDTFFSSVRDISGATCAQVFYGLSSHFINIYGMHTESDGPN